MTIDCNASLAVTKGDSLYTNLYHEMSKILDDTVGKHDLIHPCCRPEMYDHFYRNGLNHPNCRDNINALIVKIGLSAYDIITPLNIWIIGICRERVLATAIPSEPKLFTNTEIESTGKIRVRAPFSHPGDYVALKTLMPTHFFVAACRISESECNGGRCTPIKVFVNL